LIVKTYNSGPSLATQNPIENEATQAADAIVPEDLANKAAFAVLLETPIAFDE